MKELFGRRLVEGPLAIFAIAAQVPSGVCKECRAIAKDTRPRDRASFFRKHVPPFNFSIPSRREFLKGARLLKTYEGRFPTF
jgi:hypothetical protein